MDSSYQKATRFMGEMMNPEGRYIVIEGNDGTGKSTQVELLAEYFRGQGREVCVVEEPGSDDPDKSTSVANELRQLIKNGNLKRAPEINLGLFSAARRELWLEKIKPALGRGAIVLAARNYFSTLAYQGYGEGMDLSEIRRMTEIFTDHRYMNPDLAIVLLADDQTRRQRIAQRGELENPDTFESRADGFQERVNQGYAEIAKAEGIITISATGSIEEIHAKLVEIIAKTS